MLRHVVRLAANRVSGGLEFVGKLPNRRQVKWPRTLGYRYAWPRYASRVGTSQDTPAYLGGYAMRDVLSYNARPGTDRSEDAVSPRDAGPVGHVLRMLSRR